jgi:hypothetical protein
MFGANSRRLNLQFFLNFMFFVHITAIKPHLQIAIKDCSFNGVSLSAS